jgi:hypothetical protein
VRTLRHLKTEAAKCPDDQDWWYAWQIEQYEGSGNYRGWLRLKKSKIWRWRMKLRIDEEGMSLTDDHQSAAFNLDAIKEVPIDSLIPYGPTWRSDQRWTYRCPVHNEKTASFVWYRTQNSWHCFGCNQGGSVIDLLIKIENIDFATACRRLTS